LRPVRAGASAILASSFRAIVPAEAEPAPFYGFRKRRGRRPLKTTTPPSSAHQRPRRLGAGSDHLMGGVPPAGCEGRDAGVFQTQGRRRCCYPSCCRSSAPTSALTRAPRQPGARLASIANAALIGAVEQIIVLCCLARPVRLGFHVLGKQAKVRPMQRGVPLNPVVVPAPTLSS